MLKNSKVPSKVRSLKIARKIIVETSLRHERVHDSIFRFRSV